MATSLKIPKVKITPIRCKMAKPEKIKRFLRDNFLRWRGRKFKKLDGFQSFCL